MNAATLPRILMIDDNPSDIELCVMALEEGGVAAQITTAHDGEAAMALLRRLAAEAPAAELPDLILLDINMPRADGHAVLRCVRSLPALATVPVVMLTTSDSAADRQRATLAGATAYLVKPRRFEDLVAQMERLRPLLGN